MIRQHVIAVYSVCPRRSNDSAQSTLRGSNRNVHTALSTLFFNVPCQATISIFRTNKSLFELFLHFQAEHQRWLNCTNLVSSLSVTSLGRRCCLCLDIDLFWLEHLQNTQYRLSDLCITGRSQFDLFTCSKTAAFISLSTRKVACTLKYDPEYHHILFLSSLYVVFCHPLCLP